MRIAHGSGVAALAGRAVGRRLQRPLTLDRAEARADCRHNLPVPVTSFIGRTEALVAIGQHLGTTRLLTLTGAGGIGKTRLALQLAGTLVDTYADGVWLVELAALNDPTLVPRAVAAALAIQTPFASTVQEALVDALESREMLLVLDNCEHLVDAAAQLADRLLRACPVLRILATSREPLGIAGEIAWRVPGLDVPAPARREPGEPCPGSAPLTEAGQLFAERARAVRAGNLSLERFEFARARAHLEWALDTARSLGSRSLAADALTQLGHAARQEHRWAEARALYTESLGLRRALADRLGEAWALVSLGHLALAEGNLSEAHACYEQGLKIAREREVAILVARGAGNVEISTELVIARRTVEAHISAVLGKLGLSTRTQLALWAVEHGLTSPRYCHA